MFYMFTDRYKLLHMVLPCAVQAADSERALLSFISSAEPCEADMRSLCRFEGCNTQTVYYKVKSISQRPRQNTY